MFYKGKHERRPLRRRGSRVMLGIAVVSLLSAVLPSASTFSAFTYTTPNSGNTGAAGTVALTDNDSGTAMLTMSNAKPGDTDTSCVQVTSTGTLASLVKLYGTTTGSGLDAYLTLTVTRGSGAAGFDDCTGFTADATNYAGLGAGVLYNGTLTAYPDSYAAGLTDPRTASIPEAWTTGETHTYRLALTVADNNSAQTLNVTQAFTWEARNTTLYSQVVMSDQPASYWKLDEAAGTTATDAMGVANGTYANSPTLNQTSGVRDANSAVRFDGVNSLITMGDVYDYAGTASFSIEAWAKPLATNPTTFLCLVCKLDTGGWQVAISSSDAWMPDTVNFKRQDATTQDEVYATAPITLGAWMHVVATYDGSSMRLYVNGVLQNTTASAKSQTNHTGPVTVGRYVWGGVGTLNGPMDEVAIYSKALSTQQVTEHYNAGRR